MIYTIKKGKFNEGGLNFPNLFSGKFKKTWRVALAPNCWYEEGLEINQISKLVGVTEFWSANNKNSIMLGYEPCRLPEIEILEKYPHCKNLGGTPQVPTKYFNLYHYVNDKTGGYEATFITVVADWGINDAIYTIERKETTNNMFVSFAVEQFDPSKIQNGTKTSLYPLWNIEVEDPLKVPYLKGWLREIFLYFGGRSVAPWDMQYKIS